MDALEFLRKFKEFNYCPTEYWESLYVKGTVFKINHTDNSYRINIEYMDDDLSIGIEKNREFDISLKCHPTLSKEIDEILETFQDFKSRYQKAVEIELDTILNSDNF